MRLGTEDKKKLGIAAVTGVLGLGAAVYLYTQLFSSDAPAPSAPPAASASGTVAQGGGAAGSSRTSGSAAGGRKTKPGKQPATLDPTLKMRAMLVTESLVYTGGGRNIFSLTSAPLLAAIPKPIASARPKPTLAQAAQPSGPPPPPPIDLKFFGTSTSANGHRQAFLLHGEDVFLASDGDIVQRRYRIVSVSANAIIVEDLTNNHSQTLPLLAN